METKESLTSVFMMLFVRKRHKPLRDTASYFHFLIFEEVSLID